MPNNTILVFEGIFFKTVSHVGQDWILLMDFQVWNCLSLFSGACFDKEQDNVSVMKSQADLNSELSVMFYKGLGFSFL